MRELPQSNILEGFYIWFNIHDKEEHYSTPLYLYSTLRHRQEYRAKLYLELEQDISKMKPSKKTEVLLHPSTINIHYTESIGTLLTRLLNADFSTFESAYNTFLYAYGFELIKAYAPYIELKPKYDSEVQFIEMLKQIYQDSLDKLIEIRYTFKKCVDFVYNLNGNDDLKEYKPYSKLIAYTIKNDIYTYSQDTEVILDNFVSRHHKYKSQSLTHLAEQIENNELSLDLNHFYTSDYLSNICFTVLSELVKYENLHIKTCQNCGRYFIPTFRQSEIYCDWKNIDGSPTCREKGATKTYRKNLENVPALLEYRRSYQQKVMVVYRNKNDKKIKKDFDKWKNEAQSRIKKFKKGEITEDELYKWIINNK